MEAIVGVECSSRDAALEHIWEQVANAFNSENIDRARKAFGLYECVEAMTEKEYECSRECDHKDCHCHD